MNAEFSRFRLALKAMFVSKEGPLGSISGAVDTRHNVTLAVFVAIHFTFMHMVIK